MVKDTINDKESRKTTQKTKQILPRKTPEQRNEKGHQQKDFSTPLTLRKG
jgi:hypothetical protein